MFIIPYTVRKCENVKLVKMWLFYRARKVCYDMSMTQNGQGGKGEDKEKYIKKYKNKKFRPTITQKFQIGKIPQENAKLSG